MPFQPEINVSIAQQQQFQAIINQLNQLHPKQGTLPIQIDIRA